VKRLLLVLVLWGCNSEEPSDSGSPPSDLPEICVDAPTVTWANFGAGFITQHCQACHASSTPDRHGAPESVLFDTEEQVWALADRILARAVGEAPTMPPQGGVSEDDIYLLEVWLTCGG
jgi:uncharacterized membrane protein